MTVYVDGVLQTQGADDDFTISGGSVIFNTALESGDAVDIIRDTSQSTRLVDYAAGADLTEDDLDTDSMQAVYMAQEALDQAEASLPLIYNETYDAGSVRIVEVADPTGAQDAATKEYVDEVLLEEGNLPASTETEDGDVLAVTAEGVAAWVELSEAYVPDGLIDAGMLADNAVDEEHIVANAVTSAEVDSTVAVTDASNTFSDEQEIRVTGATSDLTLIRADVVVGAHNVAVLTLSGQDDADADQIYAQIVGRSTDDAAAEPDGRLQFFTVQGGAVAARVNMGAGIFTPSATGGDQGVDTINASGVYDDGSLLTCYVFEGAIEGRINQEKWDSRVINRPIRDPETGDQIGEEVRTHDRARDFNQRMARDLDPEQYSEFWKANKHLPAFPDEDTWEGKGLSLGELLQRLWETVEVQAVHIEKLLTRLKALEAR